MVAHIVKCTELSIIRTCQHPRHVEVRAAQEASRTLQAPKVAHTHPLPGEYLSELPRHDLWCGVPRGRRCGSLQHKSVLSAVWTSFPDVLPYWTGVVGGQFSVAWGHCRTSSMGSAAECQAVSVAVAVWPGRHLHGQLL